VKGKTKLVLLILAIWFGVALAVGLTGGFNAASPATVALTVWTLTAILLLVWWKMPTANRWLNTADLRWLMALHLARFVGIYFLILCKRGELSCQFARPAGIGDIATASGAAILLIWAWVRNGPSLRTAILIWNTFGVLDIIFVVFNAFRVGLTDWHGMAALRTLPLMLLPSFLVPFIIASHVIIFARLIKRRDELVSSH
jgi:hypothetical protein